MAALEGRSCRTLCCCIGLTLCWFCECVAGTLFSGGAGSANELQFNCCLRTNCRDIAAVEFELCSDVEIYCDPKSEFDNLEYINLRSE